LQREAHRQNRQKSNQNACEIQGSSKARLETRTKKKKPVGTPNKKRQVRLRRRGQREKRKKMPGGKFVDQDGIGGTVECTMD